MAGFYFGNRNVYLKMICFINVFLFADDPPYSDNGFICNKRCGVDGFFKGKYWCFIVSKYQDDWDYCSPYGNFSEKYLLVLKLSI